MATYRGLFLRLKDKHTNVHDKLKLAKFAWGTESVVIPNKYQQILDYLCGLLVNKKKHKISPNDEITIWNAVKSFLEVSKSSIPVKASIIQVITEAVLLPVKSKTSSAFNFDLLSSVISTAEHLLEIPSITSSHFENQCQLLSAVCQLHLALSPSQLKQCHASSLLKSTVEIVTKNQLRHSNQIQVFTSTNEKLLAHALKCQQKYFSPELECFLLSYLLHADHQDSYIAFLKHGEEQTQNWSKPPPKHISSALSVLAAQRTSNMATSLLPAFIQRFVQINAQDPRSCFLMLKHTLMSILGLDLTDTNLPSYLANEEWMICIAGCCQVCSHCDLISANNDQNDVTKWFCQLTEIVLLQKRDSSWFDYMTSLLSLSPLVVEKYLVSILQHGLTDSQQVMAECANAQDSFLSDLLSLYLKLRRTQDLITSLISALDLKVSGLDRICTLRDFHRKLSVMFNEVPLVSLTAIWEKFLQCASGCFSSGQDLDTDSEQSRKLSFVLILLTRLLNHAKIFGQRSMGISGHRVELLMNQMEQNLLLPLSKKKNIRQMTHFKELLNVWAAAKMLFYPRWRELPVEEEGEKDDTDSKGLQKLYQKTDLPSRVRLKLQRHNITKAVNDADLSSISDASSTVLELLEFPPLTEDIVFMQWDQDKEEKNLHQELVHQFIQFTSVFPLVGQYLDSHAIEKCADVVVQVMSHQSKDSSEGIHTKGTSLYQEVSRFLSHPATREVKSLQTALVANIWRQLLSLSDQDGGSPKKKKKKRESGETFGSQTVHTLYQFITSMKEDDMPDFTMNLDEISKGLSVNADQALPLIKVLLSLDLECVRLINLKCQLGFLTLAACRKNGDTDAVSCLVDRGLSQCLSVPNLSEFFKCIKPEIFLTFIIDLCCQTLSTRQTLLSCAVFGVMNDRSAVLSLPSWIKQLTTELRGDDSGSLPNTTKIQACALLIHNCGRYVSKNFHIQEVASAAMDIFCTLSKFTIKHSLKWLNQHGKSDPSSARKEETKSKRKRKSLSNTLPANDSHDDTNSEVWRGNLNCYSEVLHLWTNDIADERISEQLCSSVELIQKKIQKDLIAKADMDEKTKITQLRFLEACCHCHQRLSQGTKSPQSTSTPQSLLNDESIAQIWSSCFALCQAELSSHVSKSLSKCVSDAAVEDSLAIEDWQTWPSSVTACVDVLTSVTECVTPAAFTHYLNSIMALLVPEKDLNVPAVFVVIAVWRRLLKSTFLSETSVKEIFACIYEFLSSSLSMLQHLESLKPAALEHLTRLVATTGANKEISSLSDYSSISLSHNIWIPSVSRFLLHAMADFIDLSKIIITPRTILLCLQAGATIVVTSTRDLDALQRLVNTFVVHHPVAATKASATVVSFVSKLICSCVSLGFTEHLSAKSQQVEEVVHSAQLITRVLIVLASGDYKKELAKVAYCALSDYIMEVQKGTLHTSVKKELVRGLYRLISICDKYRLASLYTSLPPGVKDTFKFMHQDYEKYYRYTGTV